MLHGDAAAERSNTVDGSVRDCLGMIEEPVQTIERCVAMNLFEGIECSRDRLVISRMHSPGPFILRENAYDVFELTLHLRRHIGTRHAEVFKIRGREYQHLAGTVVTEIVGA